MKNFKSIFLSIVFVCAILSSANCCYNLAINTTESCIKNTDSIQHKTCSNILNPNRKRTC